MILTDAGSEGLNLQFCNTVINYDLPWNPMKIEQRIGRCHRYGQKNDVVAINLLNTGNQADMRVYEILSKSSNYLTECLVHRISLLVYWNPESTSNKKFWQFIKNAIRRLKSSASLIN